MLSLAVRELSEDRCRSYYHRQYKRALEKQVCFDSTASNGISVMVIVVVSRASPKVCGEGPTAAANDAEHLLPMVLMEVSSVMILPLLITIISIIIITIIISSSSCCSNNISSNI